MILYGNLLDGLGLLLPDFDVVKGDHVVCTNHEVKIITEAKAKSKDLE